MSSDPEVLLGILDDLGDEDFRRFKWYFWHGGALEGFKPIPKSKVETLNREDTVDKIFDTYSDRTLEVTKMVLEKMQTKGKSDEHTKKTSEPEVNKGEHHPEEAHLSEKSQECQKELKSNLNRRFRSVFEGVAIQGESTLLNQIYTELHITEGGAAEVNQEHEVRQIEAASRTADRAETSIRPGDIFKASPGRSQPIRRVLTKGVAGIGKTVLTQKFTLDWAEDKDNQDVHFIFPFTFRELNVMKEEKFSLVGLVHHFFSETEEAGICSFKKLQVIFIFDGLDECRLPLDFHHTKFLTDIRKSTSVDVLLINLIRGKLLPSARLWITTRPAAANQIPADCVDMVTEVRGFTDPQKEEYFRRRFREEEQASRIISHIKTSRSLHIMCHIPVFCWITAEVLEEELKSREGGELPKNLTEVYIRHLVMQVTRNKVKYDGGAAADPHWSPESTEMIESLGKLAFDHLQKGNLIFYERDLIKCGIDREVALKYSGMFTQIFKKEKGLRDKVFHFIHLTFQEFLAALHVHQTFINSGINLLEEQQTWWLSNLWKQEPKLHHVHQRAVDEALKSPNGHLDLFLRFLLGLSLETNQSLLRGLLTQTGSSSQSNQKTVKYIKKNLSESLSAERSINLFHCLNELNDGSLVEQIQQSLRSGSLSTDRLSPAQWSALVFILLSSEEDLKEFDLKKYSASEEALLKLLPVVKASNKALLSGCGLSERSCGALSSVLSSQSSSLTHLDLSNNELQDSGVKRLSLGLESPHCKLEALRLSGCGLSERSCGALSSFLSSQSSSLTHLDLSNNDLQDSGMEPPSAAVEDPHCSLETLRLSCCGLSERSCGALSSVLSSQSSSLTHLDLSNNELQDSGVKRLSLGLESPHCKLEALRLSGCGLSERSCGALSSVLSSQSSSLTHLDLSNNDLQDSGVKRLSLGLESPHCKLEALSLSGCLVSEEGCASLVSAVRSKSSHLRELDLSYNHPGDSGVKELSAAVEDPHCSLETLRVDHGGQQGIQQITNFKGHTNSGVVPSTALAEELNTFFARFETPAQKAAVTSPQPHPTSSSQALTVQAHEVERVLKKVNPSKASGPDGVPGKVLKACATQLSQVFTKIINLSLTQSTIPACLKSATMIPVPKKSATTSHKDHRPVALTPIITKCLERLVLNHIMSCLPASLDPYQFAYRANRSTEDAIAITLHIALSHLEHRESYVRMLFVDFTSAFNTIIPDTLVRKLIDLGLPPLTCTWIKDFLTNRPQTAKLGPHQSSTRSLSTGSPQGCVLSPLLYTLYTTDCSPAHSSNTIIKFADDTTVVGLITRGDESAYRDEVLKLAEWCSANNLSLNTTKSKEVIVDFRKRRSDPPPLFIHGDPVERVHTFTFLGTVITDNLSWSANTSAVFKRAQQRLHFLRVLRKSNICEKLLVTFYRSTVESILTYCITVWFSHCTEADRQRLQRVRLIHIPLPQQS
ncbi:NACHT, LRR and PYD domains-containing protein 3-like [Salarias fasciatus]|uniref:NACHT, LRR and PYD domains-containing protein 3-like n=1 Tax=Salarias fasciatus TaxID=181472 RepID=UPI0011767365|nr:NACHT, LRR and PYD domains-containing protein 3-like [Salarias fasciatus]